MKYKVVWILAGAAAFVALLAYLTVSGNKVRVEVCMEFQGRQSCRVASASTEPEALRTAVDNACATIAFGVTDNGQCTRSRPVSIRRLN